MALNYRLINQQDNAELEQIIKQSLREYSMDKEGTVFTDPVIKEMSQSFSGDRAAYWIAESDGEMCGGGGIAPLVGGGKEECELQRMFLKKEFRGKKIGYEILHRCIDFAKQQGFTFCYLETSEALADAVALYSKFGFEQLESSMGTTGHFSCQLYMGMHLK